MNALLLIVCIITIVSGISYILFSYSSRSSNCQNRDVFKAAANILYYFSIGSLIIFVGLIIISIFIFFLK